MRWQDALRERLPKKTVRFMYMTALGPKNRQLPLWIMAGTNAFNISCSEISLTEFQCHTLKRQD